MASWFARPINLGIAIGAAMLFVVALVTTVYSTVTHSETGLLQVCWHPDGHPRYVDTNSLEWSEYLAGPAGYCAKPVGLEWSRKQIPLAIEGWDADEDELRPVKAAVADINKQVGFTLFRISDLDDDPPITIDISAEVPASAMGQMFHWTVGPGKILRCTIEISNTLGSERLTYLVFRHELLQCSGLARDLDNPASAVYPLTHDDTMEERMMAALITDFDRALLKRLYHD